MAVLSAEEKEAALAQIADEIKVCLRCELHKTRTKAVPGEGPADARVMLIGEAPGWNEDQQGRPFVGAAVKFLQELLASAGMTRDEVFITNARIGVVPVRRVGEHRFTMNQSALRIARHVEALDA